jgi:hypothetical protein
VSRIMPMSSANRNTIWLGVRPWRVAMRATAGWASKDTYHIVGFTTAAPGDFFADEGFAGDDLRGADLRYKQAQK